MPTPMEVINNATTPPTAEEVHALLGDWQNDSRQWQEFFTILDESCPPAVAVALKKSLMVLGGISYMEGASDGAKTATEKILESLREQKATATKSLWNWRK